MSLIFSRRHFLLQAAGAAATAAVPLNAKPRGASGRPAWSAAAAKPTLESGKKFGGIFIIVSTPYTEAGAVDFDDLAREIDWLDRCGVQGVVWPQLASEYVALSKDERLRGMEVIARAAKGKRPAVVFGVQAANQAAALQFAQHATGLNPNALIAMPPSEGKTLEDYRAYYHAIAKVAKQPLFMQTTGGAPGVNPPVEFILDLARDLPNLRYVKEEVEPVTARMSEELKHRDIIDGVFSGNSGHGMLYEMSLGFSGTMPAATYADVYAQIWSLFQSGRRNQARDLFARLLLMLNTEQIIPGTRRYLMKKRGVFKTTVSRLDKSLLTPEAIREIEFQFEALRPYLKV